MCKDVICETFISVVVLNYNGKSHLDDCLGSLKNINYANYDVFLVDNASTDDSLKYVRDNYPWVKLISLDKNYGFAEGYNIAISKIDSEFIAILNNDVGVDRNYLSEIHIELSKPENKDIFAFGSLLLDFYKPNIIDNSGLLVTYCGTGFGLDNLKDRASVNNTPIAFAFTCGAAMVVRRSLFLEIGGFDPDYFAYAEDIDICWRAWLFGYRTMIVRRSIVYHKYGGSWGSLNSPNRLFLDQKNRLANIIKNCDSSIIIPCLTISLLYDLFRLGIFLYQNRPDNIKSVIYGTYIFLLSTPALLEKRKTIMHNKKKNGKYLKDNDLIASLYCSVRRMMHEKYMKSNQAFIG